MAELLRMRHPEIEHGDAELPVTTRQAFEDVWQGKGWEEDTDAPAPLVAGPDEPESHEQPQSGARRSRSKG